MYKGKYREGRDKADPTMWKTRLRCALNKSTDFQEVPERNQLDITEPYKVYRIQHDNGPAKPAGKAKENVSFPFLVILSFLLSSGIVQYLYCTKIREKNKQKTEQEKKCCILSKDI